MEAFETHILAGDIGGTKTSLAIFSTQSDLRTPLFEATFSSRKYPSLELLALDFLSRTKLTVTRASFCVAGPVIDDKARITNLPWVINKAKLSAALGFSSVRLSNDLQAFAQAIPLLRAEDIHTLNPGVPAARGTILVIAPGTGLGEAYLTWDGNKYHAHPSEGGHADFAPIDDLQTGLLTYLLKRFGHVSYERVCSGIGLPNIYDYVKEIDGPDSEPEWLADKIAESRNPTAVIVLAALDEDAPIPICKKSLDLFVSILGAASGNAALHTMALGGVYLGGGIPPRILPALVKEPFMQAFTHKGRFSQLMTQIPVHVILNPRVALWGAATLAMA